MTKRYKVVNIIEDCNLEGCTKPATWGISDTHYSNPRVIVSLEPMCRLHIQEMVDEWNRQEAMTVVNSIQEMLDSDKEKHRG